MTPFDHLRGTGVAVFGAGPAGMAAAVAAAREGQQVSLFEVQDRIGGVMASCPGMMLDASDILNGGH
jgi:NADPH-dependent glutamate synthase beta subunit-like oxidoreductase